MPRLRLLASSRTREPHQLVKLPWFSHSRLSKHPWTGSVHSSHHLLTIWMEPWDFIKSSAHTYKVYMELKLCLSFQPRHSLGGYMVATTAGFWVVILEALASWSHFQISRWFPQYHMSTYSTSYRANGSGHLLDGRLRGYYQGLVPRVPCVTDYGT
jgi:hypothetical protein